MKQTQLPCSEEGIAKFQDAVWSAYRDSARIAMPWRDEHSPYYVLLSEFMLQQTQIARVTNYFTVFTARWPRLCDLAGASLSDVLQEWMGLGYYRRAKYLHAAAQVICSRHGGVVPRDEVVLRALPGIGEYTAAAICAFAYNMPAVVVETNIRRAIIYHFFAEEARVLEKDVRACVSCTLDKANPRLWYWALMDYGAALGYKVQNPNRRSAVYARQSKFEGSNRQVRAAILRAVVQGSGMRAEDIVHAVRKKLNAVKPPEALIYKNIDRLTEERLMVCEEQVYYVK